MSNLGNKQIMANNIRHYMNVHSVSQTEICNTLGFKMPTFSDWVNAKTYPRIDKIELMANYFGITKADLVEDHSSRPHSLQCQTKAEETLVLSYRELNDINKKKSVAYTKNLLSTQRMEDELLAAHERTDIEITPEGVQSDLDIMNNENLWK